MKISEILEIADKRTKGKWRSGQPMEENGYKISYIGTDCDNEYKTGDFYKDGYNFSARSRDANYIAIAPEMESKLRQIVEMLPEIKAACRGVIGGPACFEYAERAIKLLSKLNEWENE